MLNWLKKYLRARLGITALEQQNKKLSKALEKELKLHRKIVASKIAELQDYTRVDADVGFRGENTIILTGVYRNKAYVKFYDMGSDPFVSLVDQLKSMRGHSLIRHIDTPPQFHGTFDIAAM